MLTKTFKKVCVALDIINNLAYNIFVTWKWRVIILTNMVKKAINIDILESIQRYIKEVKKYYKIDSVILFGSYAKGTNHKDSDIDIAVISSDIKNEFEDGVMLLKLTWNIDTRIEPHAFSKDNLNENPFADEIIKTGIEIYAA